MPLKQIFLWALAVFLLIDNISRVSRTNLNLGTGMMYALTVAVWVYTIFNRQIDAFCSFGFGLALKIIFFCGCTFTAGMIVFIAISGGADKADGDEAAVIVLGAGLRGEQVSGVLARRLDAAYAHYVKNPTVLLVVSGGQGPQEIIPEAHAMRSYLLARGVPPEQILVEDKSTSTEENFAFSLALLAKNDVSAQQPIAFATNQFHCYRAGKYARDVGFTDVDALPAPTGVRSLAPCYLREVLAVLYYWVFRQ